MKKNFFKNYFADESDCNVSRTRFIQDRIKIVEKYIPELEKVLFDYVDKSAKSRDCSDKIALVLDDYAKAESVTCAFKLQISDFANIILDIGALRDTQVQAMEMKVLEHLGDYDKLCKIIYNDLKLSLTASNKEKSCLRQLEKMREIHPQDPQQLSLAEAEYLKVRGECSRLSKNLQEQIDIFERKRLSAIKEVLLSWTTAELHFHSKALQLFTDAYRVAADIDVNFDVEEFRNKLWTTEDTPRSDSMQRSESIFQLLALPLQKLTFIGNGIPHPSSVQSFLQSSSSSFVSFEFLKF